MTDRDAPTEATLHIPAIPIKTHCDFKIACARNRQSMRAEVIRLMELYAKTGGKCLKEDIPPAC